MANVMETGVVDAVVPFFGDSYGLIWNLRPDVVIRGYDQGDEGGTLTKIIRIPRLPNISTTAILAAQRGVSET